MGSSGLARLGRRARLHKGLIATSLPQRQDGLHRAGQPWENSYIESFNARLRDELLDGEIFYTLREARIVMESWRRHYNAVRPTPHSDTSRQHRRHSPRGGYATSTGFAGHAGAQANPKLTFHLDHSVGADRSELIGSSFSLKTVLEVRKLAHHDTLLSGGSIPSIARKKPKSA